MPLPSSNHPVGSPEWVADMQAQHAGAPAPPPPISPVQARSIRRLVARVEGDKRALTTLMAGLADLSDDDGSTYARHGHELVYDETMDMWVDPMWHPDDTYFGVIHPATLAIAVTEDAPSGWVRKMRDLPLTFESLDRWAA